MRTFYPIPNNEKLYYPLYRNPKELLNTLEYFEEAINKFFEDNYTNNDLDIPLIRLWCSGSSGISLATLISSRIDIYDIVYVPKPNESNHGHGYYSGTINNSTAIFNVFIDDFMDEGTTLLRIYKAAKTFNCILSAIWCFETILEVEQIEHYIGREFRQISIGEEKKNFCLTFNNI